MADTTERERLDPGEILKTAARLRDRVGERFPGSGLSKVGEQLVRLASRAEATSAEVKKPNYRVRALSYLVIALLVIALVVAVSAALGALDLRRGITWTELVQVVEAGTNDLLLLGAAIYFFFSYERRFKRGKVVKALHELRTLAHLIDVHQLTKTPEVLGNDALRTKSSPDRRLSAFELGRYLDYCTEMLALTGKIAALYGDGFDDSDALEAVNEIEELTIGLSTKIWQKLILLQGLDERRLAPGEPAAADAVEGGHPAAPRTVAAGAADEAAAASEEHDARTSVDAPAADAGAGAAEPAKEEP